MLTKQDLSQIKKVVRNEVESGDRAIKSDLKSEITRTRVEVLLKIGSLADRVKDLEIQVNENSKDIKKIDKKVDKVIDFFDNEVLSLAKRTKLIETHLNIQPIADF